MAIHDDFVARPLFEPHRCSFTLRSEDPDGFFQGRNLTGPADVAYISVSRVRAYAESLGFMSPENARALLDDRDTASAYAKHLEGQVARLEAEADAIDGIVRSRDYVVRKRVGRPPEKEKVA